ncbi:MAG: class I SAM-dependent methyltransferase [Chloroflexota bacterium]
MSLRSEGAWWDFVRFGFRLLYHEMAWTYDTVSYVVSLGQWRCWQRTALNYLSAPDDGLILEIAHGTGNLQLDFAEAGYTTVAFDYSAQMGQIARSKLIRNNISTDFTQGKAQELPFADKSFASIVTTFPTNFIVQPETLREAYRVLKANGCLIAVLNGQLTGGDMMTSFIEWLYEITGQRGEEAGSASGFFEGYGFEVSLAEVDCKNSKAQSVILRK